MALTPAQLRANRRYRERQKLLRRPPVVMPPVPDSSDFEGPGAIFALVLAWVRYHYWYAPEDSPAFETARMFLEGSKCEHVRCSVCGQHCDSLKVASSCGCGHMPGAHWFVEYDWKEHRDMLIGSLGMNVPGLVDTVKRGRPCAT